MHILWIRVYFCNKGSNSQDIFLLFYKFLNIFKVFIYFLNIFSNDILISLEIRPESKHETSKKKIILYFSINMQALLLNIIVFIFVFFLTKPKSSDVRNGFH